MKKSNTPTPTQRHAARRRARRGLESRRRAARYYDGWQLLKARCPRTRRHLLAKITGVPVDRLHKLSFYQLSHRCPVIVRDKVRRFVLAPDGKTIIYYDPFKVR